MTVILIILASMVAVGLPLYLHHRLTGGHEQAPEAPMPDANADDGCCGLHITCEKDSLVAGIDAEVVYYDDEELDVYAGRNADSYTEAETEAFRDVLLTMEPDDIAGWSRSLQTRGIALPTAVRDELLLIVSEVRQSRLAPSTP